MAAGVFVFDVIATLVLSGALLYNYGNWMRHRVLVTLAVLIAWYFSFLIIFILPLDVSGTIYRQCVNATIEAQLNKLNMTSFPVKGDGATNNATKAAHDSVKEHDARLVVEVDEFPGASKACQEPYSLLDAHTLPGLWRIVYWSSQLLTWLILPVMQSFSQAGEFTFSGKLKSSLWDNAIFYSSYLLIALILVVYIALQPDLHLTWDRTKAIAASASNTWGLFVLVLMLGYGLVEVPRTLWFRSQRGYQLTHAHFKVSKLMSEKSDAEETLEDVLFEVHLMSNEIEHLDSRRPWIDTILRKIPTELMDKVKRRRTNDGGGQNFGDVTEKSLIKLHRQVIQAVQAYNRTEAQWSDWTDHVFELEDINRNMVSNEHRFVRSGNGGSRPPTGFSQSLLVRTLYSPVVEWYWKCLVKPILLKVGAAVATLMSILIIWSEITFFSIRPTLSVFAGIVSAAGSAHDYMALEAVCLVTVFYLCLCTYYTIFKVRVLNYYYLAPNHHSDEYTLLFSGALLCRLTPPLCLNFLSLIHMDSHVIQSKIMETAYTQVMGHMDVVSIVSDYFNIYFPIALLALTLATYFSLGARILTGLGFQQFLTQDSELTLELVEEGKEHMKREKRRRQRMAESATRRREFASRFGGGGNASNDPESSRGSSADVRQRSADIVKTRGSTNQNVVSSPERSLLSNQASPHHNLAANPASAMDETPSGGDLNSVNIDLTSPVVTTSSHQVFSRIEPPKNIFDDL